MSTTSESSIASGLITRPSTPVEEGCPLLPSTVSRHRTTYDLTKPAIGGFPRLFEPESRDSDEYLMGPPMQVPLFGASHQDYVRHHRRQTQHQDEAEAQNTYHQVRSEEQHPRPSRPTGRRQRLTHQAPSEQSTPRPARRMSSSSYTSSDLDREMAMWHLRSPRGEEHWTNNAERDRFQAELIRRLVRVKHERLDQRQRPWVRWVRRAVHAEDLELWWRTRELEDLQMQRKEMLGWTSGRETFAQKMARLQRDVELDYERD
ncbi:hypothetical protein F4677DRAFT_445464 [Hypoxylon crocopeplum]|nr:hypothetical protein F4677DRAFT_445464 [Hypoxylon crocopeplum]